MRMRPCLKQTTRCVIVRADGRRYEATNECAVDGLEVCPRVTAECPTGEGYYMCGSTHAEANCAALAADSADVPGEAFLYGHTWLCGPCQHALTAVNVRTFHVVAESHPAARDHDCAYGCCHAGDELLSSEARPA